MTKAKFLEQQPKVKVSEIQDKYFIFICLNEEKTIEDDSLNGESIYYEYDYEEIVVDKDNIDISDVKINPENYLNYVEDSILEDIKARKIIESKIALESYLSEHPLLSCAKYKEGRYYNVTEEKQRQLTSKIAMYGLYQQQSLSYNLLKWNDTGNVCEAWTIEQLTQLAMEIDKYVTPLVTKQQTYEKNINEAKNLSEIEDQTLFFGD